MSSDHRPFLRWVATPTWVELAVIRVKLAGADIRYTVLRLLGGRPVRWAYLHGFTHHAYYLGLLPAWVDIDSEDTPLAFKWAPLEPLAVVLETLWVATWEIRRADPPMWGIMVGPSIGRRASLDALKCRAKEGGE